MVCIQAIAQRSQQSVQYEGRFFYVRIVVDLMQTAKVNAYIKYIIGKIELLSIHAT